MGQILHGSATTTHAIRAAIQRSKATAKELAERHGLNPKTVAKWKKRTFVHDAPMGPKNPRSTVLSVEEEAIVVAFRKHTLLPLDDCLYALQATIPHLTRSSLHCSGGVTGTTSTPSQPGQGTEFARRVGRAVPPPRIRPGRAGAHQVPGLPRRIEWRARPRSQPPAAVLSLRGRRLHSSRP